MHLSSASLSCFLVVLLHIAHEITAEKSLPQCGKRFFGEDDQFSSGDTRAKHLVKNGRAARPKEFPWMVEITKGGKFHCGAYIVGDRWLLTAAHCVMRRWGPLEFWAGHLNQSDPSKVRLMPKRVAEYGHLAFFDQAIVELEKPIEFNDFMQPLCLPIADSGVVYDNTSNEFTGAAAILSGWGRLYAPDGSVVKVPDVLHKTRVPFLNAAVKQGMFCGGYGEEERGDPMKAYTFCTLMSADGSACEGDSGGPLVMRDEKSDTWFVYGTVLNGDGYCNNNTTDKLTTNYDRVAKLCDWLALVTKKEVQCRPRHPGDQVDKLPQLNSRCWTSHPCENGACNVNMDELKETCFE